MHMLLTTACTACCCRQETEAPEEPGAGQAARRRAAGWRCALLRGGQPSHHQQGGACGDQELPTWDVQACHGECRSHGAWPGGPGSPAHAMSGDRRHCHCVHAQVGVYGLPMVGYPLCPTVQVCHMPSCHQSPWAELDAELLNRHAAVQTAWFAHAGGLHGRGVLPVALAALQ